MKIPVLVTELAASHAALICMSGFMINEFLLRNNKYLWPVSSSKKLIRMRSPPEGKNVRSSMFLVTMDSHPCSTTPCPHMCTLRSRWLWPNRTPRFKGIHKPKCSSQDLDLRENEQLWVQRKREKMTQEKPEKRTRVKSYFNSNQAQLSAARLQAELTQHRIPRKWKLQY